MIISELIKELEKIKKEHGDLRVCTATPHEYWGETFSDIMIGSTLNINNHAQPDGPKSGKSEKSVVFGW
jgi:hypothetical protein